jgi:hypothetical protein
LYYGFKLTNIKNLNFLSVITIVPLSPVLELLQGIHHQTQSLVGYIQHKLISGPLKAERITK